MTETDVTSDTQTKAQGLPVCYASLMPLYAEQHGNLGYAGTSDYSFARNVNAVPLLAEEFPRAQLSYPIVFPGAEGGLPVALLGTEAGSNDHINPDGTWRSGSYIPAYLRRYPFALVREKEGSDRMLLCADTTAATLSEVEPGDAGLLFDGDAPSALGSRIVDFCRRYEEGLYRTRALIADLAKHDLLQPSKVQVKGPSGKTARIEGFHMVTEEKLRALPDDALADLARRGIVGLLAAHHFSIANFSGIVKDKVS